ncbi:SdpI family protein [Domibacillus enclensis]|uniref:Uncharacterized membrane protein n=1 Tax=Domibacillus enclensis TaxID=1017273 RepID=A0A1N6WZX8_9BACI|nr:SdpI family protein [Domibacillus enclensis]OXS78076.1 hypothetical protein B1B05_10795 [Domibacillus enclensis]SIQ95642.1 Uncharacterized membrane protein [Domibacillus enclensis]
MKAYRYAGLIIIAAFVISFIAIPYLPDQIAIHWGPSGEADDYTSKWFGAFFGPLMLIFVGGLLAAAPKMDPRKQNYPKFAGSYHVIINATVTLLFIVHLLILANGLGYAVKMDVAIPILIGLLFIVIGNYMPRVRPSYMVGFRTPWTLADDRVWTKTHRTGGLLFVIGGLIILLTAFMPVSLRITAFIIVVLFITVIPLVQSYLLYKR